MIRNRTRIGRCLIECTRTFEGLTRSNSDPCVLYRTRGRHPHSCHVDDIIVILRNNQDISKLFDFLSTKFRVKNLGAIKDCLGIEFSQSRVSLSQKGYLDDVLRRFGMLESKSIGNPLDPEIRLKRNEESVPEGRTFLYRELEPWCIWRYVPDIAHAVS